MWKCRYCGNENEGMFCARCGNKRPERQPAPQKGKIGTAATVAIVASATAVAIAVVVLCVTVSKATIKQRARGFVTDYESAEEINTEVLKEEPEVIEKEAENVERRPVEELEPEEVISEEKPVEEVKEEKKNDGYSAMVAKREEFYGRAEGIQKYSDSIDWDYLNQSQLNINSGEIFSKWDALLNDVYQYLKKTKSKSEFEKIKKDEVSWIKEKEAAMKEEEKIWAGGSGTAYAVNGVGISYTKERCYELISMLY